MTSPCKKTEYPEVIVLGCCRSGTSMVSGMLARAGIDMGVSFHRSQLNPKGTMEDIQVQAILDAVFSYAWQDEKWVGFPGRMPPPHEKVLASEPFFRERIGDYVARRRNGSPWGWKNPKNCLCVDLFIPHLVNPYFVVTVRNSLENAQAVKQISGTPIIKTLNTINRMMGNVFRVIDENKIPSFMVQFDSLHEKPEEVLDGMCRFLGHHPTEEQRQQAIQFVIKGYSCTKKVGQWQINRK